MAVTTINITPTKTTTPSPLSSGMNKRWPPLADKSSLPYKLTTLSKQKLAREATAPDPDIRRCLGHFRLHCMSMEWAQRDMTTRINSIELESESESESEESESDDAVSTTVTVPTPAAQVDEPGDSTDREEDGSSDDSDSAAGEEADHQPQQTEAEPKDPGHVRFAVSFEKTSPPSLSSDDKEKEGLLEKGRNCLEKTVQRSSNFWPSPGPCMSVRI
ncbi:predicted protein [Aspergillus terreus NIH2624]|uniref:Uncharacterized protein n=1 Tax=Aspergillus terreus (strain NIH 2624 / FGSC A1156) TaxID=341663 RepID=Q0D1D1_ASPTN|nr:uncharacterized protein ATEG_00253 [Aspergillus terreus NIH2624]EAU38899.1 predicted protein [Aspergillus terreus NIH2624]